MAETDVSHSCLKGADMQTLCTWEIVMNLYAEFAHRMGGSDDPRRVHFQSPEYLVERLDGVEAIIEQLESGDPSREEGERLFEEGQQTLEKIREILDRGEGEVVELPE